MNTEERLSDIKQRLESMSGQAKEDVAFLLQRLSEYEQPKRGYEWTDIELSCSGWAPEDDTEEYRQLSYGHFHGGTTWKAKVLMEPDNVAELRDAWDANNYWCEFMLGFPEPSTKEPVA